MVDATRQVPSPGAAAWLVVLAEPGAPGFVVLRADETEAAAALTAFLLDVGVVANEEGADDLLATSAVENVGVVW